GAVDLKQREQAVPERLLEGPVSQRHDGAGIGGAGDRPVEGNQATLLRRGERFAHARCSEVLPTGGRAVLLNSVASISSSERPLVRMPRISTESAPTRRTTVAMPNTPGKPAIG